MAVLFEALEFFVFWIAFVFIVAPITILIHEIGHAAVGVRYKRLKTLRVGAVGASTLSFRAFGGNVYLSPMMLGWRPSGCTQFENAVFKYHELRNIAIGGPIANLIAGSASGALLTTCVRPVAGDLYAIAISASLFLFVFWNFYVAVINLMPLTGNDGYLWADARKQYHAAPLFERNNYRYTPPNKSNCLENRRSLKSTRSAPSISFSESRLQWLISIALAGTLLFAVRMIFVRLFLVVA